MGILEPGRWLSIFMNVGFMGPEYAFVLNASLASSGVRRRGISGAG
jgi:hypothetical protein